jgi:hypothetical protein
MVRGRFDKTSGTIVVLKNPADCSVGLFLYFPSRDQVSPALRAFVGVARELAEESKPRALNARTDSR